MIDQITGQRIVVMIHEEYGPFIRVMSYQDAGHLEDRFDDDLHVTYWKMRDKELALRGGNEYYFGTVADPVKLRTILDSIS